MTTSRTSYSLRPIIVYILIWPIFFDIFCKKSLILRVKMCWVLIKGRWFDSYKPKKILACSPKNLQDGSDYNQVINYIFVCNLYISLKLLLNYKIERDMPKYIQQCVHAMHSLIIISTTSINRHIL